MARSDELSSDVVERESIDVKDESEAAESTDELRGRGVGVGYVIVF